jgi:hypothetical protein
MESICALHGCLAVPPNGTGAARIEMLYDLLEVRITRIELLAESRVFLYHYMLN